MQSPESIPLVTVPELERLAIALQAMPQVGPERSSWESIASRLQESTPVSVRPRATQRRWVAYAAAASIAAASAWLGFAQQGRDPIQGDAGAPMVAGATPGSRGTGKASAAQEALVARSGSLERWLLESGSSQWPQDFGSASASVEIENLIAQVDQRLTRSSSDAERDRLWQRRVSLLEQLVTLQGEPVALSLPADDRTLLL